MDGVGQANEPSRSGQDELYEGFRGSKADIVVDIDGNVLSTRLYDDPIWKPHSASTGTVLAFYLLDLFTGVPDGCETGLAELDPECRQHQGGAAVFLYYSTLVWDVAA